MRDTGEYAQRGGLIDLWPAGMSQPIRLDFFGDSLESIRSFDPGTQRSLAQRKALNLVPMSEVQLNAETIRSFRQGYIAAFGAAERGDMLYEAVSEGRRAAGIEHWLPLFQDRLDTLFDYLAGMPLIFEPRIDDVAAERFKQIADSHQARRDAMGKGGEQGIPYKPLKPEQLYLTPQDWTERLSATGIARLSPFVEAPSEELAVFDLGGRLGRSFAAERTAEQGQVFDATVAHIGQLQKQGRRVVMAGWSDGSRERLGTVLGDHGLERVENAGSLAVAMAQPAGVAALAVWPLETGFELPGLAVLSEQDVLGDRLVRQKRKARKGADFIAELSALAVGDVIVHANHGIGRFVGLQTVTVGGAPHDCLELHYAGGDKLYLPVENIELLSRYGSEDTEVQLDRLGGGAWQARKARMKKRIREMADKLIQIAAARAMRDAPKLSAPEGAYDEFCARFPFEETEDQLSTIESVLADMEKGTPMDRLICGDVGFGKTEVALRAAFVAAMGGKQVAVVVPTTLLARQHFRTFAERFKGLPVEVRQASRFVAAADLKAVKEGIADGSVDIVVGTHALLGSSITFRDLGLVIVDEEQHFGVAHKERLKEMRAEVHMLTLSATPIPRTLQLAMTGVRDLSIIATPPVDRLAVRSFVTPFDPLSIREALLREHYRGGQSFLCRAAHRRPVGDQGVPGSRGARGKGRRGPWPDGCRPARGRHDGVLRRAVRRAALDHHRRIRAGCADRQHADRASRRHVRTGAVVPDQGARRSRQAPGLCAVHPAGQEADHGAGRKAACRAAITGKPGAGFQLASHDLDIRGAGNLLGEEQSGHIKEVGYELYQQMLQEAVAQMKAGIAFDEAGDEQWSPSITIGTPVMIPEHYVEDLSLRLGLYKRLSGLETERDIEGFAAEMVDRFGSMPDEVRQLLELTVIKTYCRRANVEKVEAGEKGVVLSFRDNKFANPGALVAFINDEGPSAKVRGDMKVVFQREFPTPQLRLKGVKRLLGELVKLAERVAKAA